MRVAAIAMVLAFLGWPLRAEICASGFCITGLAAARGSSTTGVESWTREGFGRLSSGADGAGGVENDATGELSFAAEWRPSESFSFRIHSSARRDEASALHDVGFDEAFAEFRHGAAGGDRLRARAGLFILPTSRENTEDLWTSPYTLTWSALNTWIAEEVRPVGLDLEYRVPISTGELTFGATGFGGNDTMGALLAWRGWAMGNRLTFYDEALPLPHLASLYDPALFGTQYEGTRPLERDLDGRPGWSARARWSFKDILLLQGTYLDNRGDRRLHDEQYAWATDFALIAAEIRLGQSTVIASEYMSGTTGMGAPPVFVSADYDALYALVSTGIDPFRFSLRYDRFHVHDRDHSVAENNDDTGDAWTAAALWQLSAHFRAGLELVDLKADHPAAVETSGSAATPSRRYMAEVRYRF